MTGGAATGLGGLALGPGLGLALAGVGALGYGAASVLEAVGARRRPGVAALVDRWTLGGLALDAVAWVASLLALRVLPVLVVQALLAGSLVVTVVLARRTTRWTSPRTAPVRLRRREVGAVVVAVPALAVVAAAGVPGPAAAVPTALLPVALGGAGVLAAVLVASYRRGRAVPLAVLGGLGFSLTAVAARVAHGGAWAGWSVVLVAGGALGMVAYLRALERGATGPVTAVLWTTEVLVPGALGLAVLGDRLRPGWAAGAAVAVAAVLGACAVLARAEPGART